MWAKLSHVLKPKAHDESEANSGTGDVMSSVFEQHPNLSVFHHPPEQPSPPPSPSKSRMALFKRRAHDESSSAPSPMKLPIGLPKKVKTTFGMQGNASQLSLGPSSSGPELSRTSSHDMLSPPAPPPKTKRRSSFNLLKRPSVDGLRSPTPTETARSPSRAEDPRPDPVTPFEAKSGSVRSILRDRGTPGTGQNVRFFSRDAYKVLSPDQSVESEYQSVMTQAIATPAPAPKEESFLDRLQRGGSMDSNVSSSLPRFASTSKPRPTVSEIFSPMNSPEDNNSVQKSDSPKDKSDTSGSQLLSQLPPLPAPDFADYTNNNFFDMDMSQDVEMQLPALPPPGLGFDMDVSLNGIGTETEGEGGPNAMTSTPYRDKGKGRAVEAKENLAPNGIDETIFHAKEKVPRLPSALQHERSNSFSAGQTLFYSIAQEDSKRSSTGDFPASAKASPMSEKDSPMSEKDSPASRHSSSSGLNLKHRGRALSETVFMSMLRSPSPFHSPSNKLPEADINDESSGDLVVYSSADVPDPFSANANAYYTPATPPQHQSGNAHGRTGSKASAASKEGEEEIFALKTQLALQTELCGQFEADLRARDELVEVLGKKLTHVEQEETKKRNLLRGWKKKVVELERACRYLEEEVEGSRQESMERSIMDEASGEALRMLHRQIAGLERERESAKRVEELLRGEVAALEGQLRERGEEVGRLRETLWRRDESERELKEGIKHVSQEMEMMGNISIPFIDEGELRKMAAEKEQRNGEEKERELQREAELGWEDEREELVAAVEHAKLENVGLVAELDNYKQLLKDNEEELGMIKSELEAQWDHTEKAGEKLEAAEADKEALERERDALHTKVAELEEKIDEIDAEFIESENKQIELEAEIQQVWDEKETLEKERDELLEQIRNQEDQAAKLKQTLQVSENRIVELDQERQYALDNVSRLEENIRRRDAEAAEDSQRVMQREAEAEALREQMSRMKREHAGALEAVAAAQTAEADAQARATKERVGDLKDEIERLRRQIHELQQESADKEVKIVQITKQRAQDKQDLQGLNIALDSKQQELELIKRKMGVRGTAGSTPAQPSKVGQRRDSAIFTTPSIGSRPSSVISDAGTDTASGSKMAALGKSSRLNSSLAGSSTSKPIAPRASGSMGPPAPVTKPRASMAGTPTPVTREPRGPILSRSASAKPAMGSTPAPAPASHRRVASATLDNATARAMKARASVNASPAPSEKENVEMEARPASRARVPVPA
ncbi:hypothetical protein B0H16DRAFT_1674764 [Mycena metata]|uniref:WH2 domain-containing protein n=1 Tax=Mycena metata TaxID=1033252 RepID=A0AAD7NDX1_9AGAR|nr:hypothetical protein B0H16DRAFT_1674764 [Mycena metata]